MTSSRLTVAAVLVSAAALFATPPRAAAQNQAARKTFTVTADPPAPQPGTIEMSREQILDHIYGGWVGMLIGGIVGLTHEFKYIEKPRETLPDFELLPQGARTDDDNDIELPHLYFMDKEGVLKLPYPRLVEMWKTNMNPGVWRANERARQLMDQGLVPPATGDPRNHEFSAYNLAGQFTVESYGLIGPGMPQAAASVAMHYALTGAVQRAAGTAGAIPSLGCLGHQIGLNASCGVRGSLFRKHWRPMRQSCSRL